MQHQNIEIIILEFHKVLFWVHCCLVCTWFTKCLSSRCYLSNVCWWCCSVDWYHGFDFTMAS